MAMRERSRDFIPGLDLARGFYEDEVAPILARRYPELEYSAALIGTGSEVLSFDDQMSMDHHWGPRAMLFLRLDDLQAIGEEMSEVLSRELPYTFKGFATNWAEPAPDDPGTQMLAHISEGPVNHRVEILTVGGFFSEYLGIDIEQTLDAIDWLTLPWQKLRSIRAGEVFRDDIGLGAVRDRLAWYPRDVWLYVLASCWSRIGEEEHLHGRAGLVGDEVGSRVIASRLVRDIMRLGFLMGREYPPYAKWLGTAFAELQCAPRLQPVLERIVSAPGWEERDAGLASAYGLIAEMHSTLGLTPELESKPEPFWNRPFQVIHGDRFADALKAAVQGEEVKAIARRRLIGNIDLVTDNTDLLEDPTRRTAVAQLY